MALISLEQVVAQLLSLYGPAAPPSPTDPWELILWENVAYLADDRKRREAMTALRESVGISPEEILNAPREQLLEVTGRGIVPEQSALKLRKCAEIALHEFGGDLRGIIKQPLPQAKRALKKFPGIGDPGAEKILLFCHKLPVLALESNGLRVLIRLGFGEEDKNYAATYQSVRLAVQDQIVEEFPWLIQAHYLLRQHGQVLCRRTRPLCDQCPLAGECVDFMARKQGGR
jgi:endonuclease III